MKKAVEGKDYTLNKDGTFNIRRGGNYSVVKNKLMRKEPDDESVDTSPIDSKKVKGNEI